MGFIRSDEAGRFLAFLADKDVCGAINGSSDGTISIREIIEYVEKRTGTKAIIDQKGENAPYNGEPEYSINTEKAGSLGFRFSVLQEENILNLMLRGAFPTREKPDKESYAISYYWRQPGRAASG